MSCLQPHLLAFYYRFKRKYTDDQLAVFDKYAAMAEGAQPKRGPRKKKLDWSKVQAQLTAGKAPQLQAIIDDKGWKTVCSHLGRRRKQLLQQ